MSNEQLMVNLERLLEEATYDVVWENDDRLVAHGYRQGEQAEVTIDPPEVDEDLPDAVPEYMLTLTVGASRVAVESAFCRTGKQVVDQVQEWMSSK